jgi:hypothetical protein
MNGYRKDGSRVQVPVKHQHDYYLVWDRHYSASLTMFGDAFVSTYVTLRRQLVLYPHNMYGPVEGDGSWEWSTGFDWTRERKRYRLKQALRLKFASYADDAIEVMLDIVFPRRNITDRVVTLWIEDGAPILERLRRSNEEP